MQERIQRAHQIYYMSVFKSIFYFIDHLQSGTSPYPPGMTRLGSIFWNGSILSDGSWPRSLWMFGIFSFCIVTCDFRLEWHFR